MENLSLYEVIKKRALKTPLAPALYYEGKTIKYRSLLNKIDLFASFLKNEGIKENDIVTVCMPNIPEAVFALYAINKIGAICYEVHPKTSKTQMKKYLNATSSKMLLVLDLFASNFIELKKELDLKIVTFNPFSKYNLLKKIYCDMKSLKKDVIRYEKVKVKKTNEECFKWQKDATCILLNSGGTSGESKLIELSQKAVNLLASCGTKILGFDDGIGEYMLAVLPMFHGFGLCMGIHAPLMLGACVSLMMKFHVKDTVKLLLKDKLTILIGVPAIFKLLCKNKKFHSKKLKNITSAYVGGDFVSPILINNFNSLMEKYGSKARLYEGYGLTETVTVCTVNTCNASKQGSVGKAVDYAKVAIVNPETLEFLKPFEQGEIVVSGDTLMNGYYKDEKLTESVFFKDANNTKWVLTKDFGYIDDEGFLYFKQRIKRIVKVSGVIICPSEIDAAVTSIDEVHEAYSTSIPHETKDHMIILFVEKDKNTTCPNEEIVEIIKKRIKEEVSVYAVPYKIYFVDKMPRTDVGKIDGKALEKSVR